MLKYHDRIYGSIKIEEPVIIDLINTPSVQRLKAIDQAGYFEPHFPGSKHSRFDHSVGVYLLLRKFGAPLEEQVAGLIHDVSHSAFSHAIDYVLDEGSEHEHNHQDNIFEKYVLESEIPGILEKHDLDVTYILNEENFPLLENNLPDICADRIDYSLRGLIMYQLTDITVVRRILNDLTVIDRQWVFNNQKMAKQYAELFCTLNKKCFSGINTAVMFRTLSDYLLHALEKGYIEKSDLYKNDSFVLNKINKHTLMDKELDNLWQRMNKGTGFKNDPNNYNTRVICKSRIIDPLFIYDSQPYRVSELYPEWRKVVEEERRPKEYFIYYVQN